MKKALLMLCLLAPACAAEAVDERETKIGAVQNIGAWMNLPTPPGNPPAVPFDSPALAKTNSQTASRWVAVITGSPGSGEVYGTYEIPIGSGNFNTLWTNISPPGGIGPESKPQVVALPANNHILIVITGGDQQMWGREQNFDGSQVYTNWHTIQPGALFGGSPALAINPSPGPGPGTLSPVLLLVGKGLDNKLYAAKNVLSGSYTNSGWSGFGQINANEVFDQSPAAVEVCKPAGTFVGSDFVVVAHHPRDGSGLAEMYEYFVNSSSTWSPVNVVYNGTFNGGPGVGCGVSGSTVEISVWGVGKDNRVYYTTQLTGGFQGFTMVGLTTFAPTTSPSVRGVGNAMKVGMRLGNNPAFANMTSP